MMFRKMREAAEREDQFEWCEVTGEMTLYMYKRGFTIEQDGSDLLFHGPDGVIVVMLNAAHLTPNSIVERWERDGVTITQTDGRAVRTVLAALKSLGPNGRTFVKSISQPFTVFADDGDGRQTRLDADRPYTSEDVDGYIRDLRIRALAEEHGLPMEYATVLFDGGAA